VAVGAAGPNGGGGEKSMTAAVRSAKSCANTGASAVPGTAVSLAATTPTASPEEGAAEVPRFGLDGVSCMG
jgi:hypothetical protein